MSCKPCQAYLEVISRMRSRTAVVSCTYLNLKEALITLLILIYIYVYTLCWLKIGHTPYRLRVCGRTI